MEKIRDHWQAHQLVKKIYETVRAFPPEEKYRLVDQLCRSVVSIPANIIEGQSRNTTKEYLHFLFNARGSKAETEYYLLLAKDLGYLNEQKYNELNLLCSEVGKMLNGLINSLKNRD